MEPKGSANRPQLKPPPQEIGVRVQFLTKLPAPIVHGPLFVCPLVHEGLSLADKFL